MLGSFKDDMIFEVDGLCIAVSASVELRLVQIHEGNASGSVAPLSIMQMVQVRFTAYYRVVSAGILF